MLSQMSDSILSLFVQKQLVVIYKKIGKIKFEMREMNIDFLMVSMVLMAMK